MRPRSAAWLTAVGRALASEREELTVLVGLLCLGWGVWTTIGAGYAAMAVGLVLLWIALPARRAFIDRPPLVPPRRTP